MHPLSFMDNLRDNHLGKNIRREISMKQHPTWQSTGSIVAERLGKVSELMLAMRGKVHLIPYMPKPFELHHIARSDGSVTQMKWWDARLIARLNAEKKMG
jgi:hypothetical protein